MKKANLLMVRPCAAGPASAGLQQAPSISQMCGVLICSGFTSHTLVPKLFGVGGRHGDAPCVAVQVDDLGFVIEEAEQAQVHALSLCQRDCNVGT